MFSRGVTAAVSVVVFCSLLACEQSAPASVPASASGDKVYVAADSDPDLAEATSKAHATLDTFLATAAAPPEGTNGFKLKVEVKDGGQSEHFWVIPFAVTAKGFEGTLANEPMIVKTVKEGQLIQIYQGRDFGLGL